MDGLNPDALNRTESHLTMLIRGRERQTLGRWCRDCPELAGAGINGITTVSQLKAWVHGLPADQADQVLRHLVVAAQGRGDAADSRADGGDGGDAAALLAVIVCLAPGIRSLAARTSISCDEAVSEIAMGILDFPVDRRSSVAAGLLLDARNRLHRHAQRLNRTCPLDDATLAQTHRPSPPEDPRDATPPAQRIVQLVAQAHRQGILNHTDARLILHTRIAGHHVKPIASQLGLSTTAAYQRRSRAEARLAELVA